MALREILVEVVIITATRNDIHPAFVSNVKVLLKLQALLNLLNGSLKVAV